MHLSIVKNQINVLKILHRDLDANLDVKTKNGVCPILLAIKSQKTDIMKYLLLNNCDTTARDSSKQGILHYAVQSQDPEILNTILRYKVEMNMSDNLEKTPIF